MTDREIMQQALEALEEMRHAFLDTDGTHGSLEQSATDTADGAITAPRERLAQPDPKHPLQAKAESESAWAARDLNCDCDHNEYCLRCFPPDFRNGGYWDQQEAPANALKEKQMTTGELSEQPGVRGLVRVAHNAIARINELENEVAVLRSALFQAREAAKQLANAKETSSSPAAWRPISLVPKGRIVLVHYKNALGNGRTMRARYYLPETLESDQTESGWADAGWYEESEAYEYLMLLEHEPTHWMPMPPDPYTTPAPAADR